MRIILAIFLLLSAFSQTTLGQGVAKGKLNRTPSATGLYSKAHYDKDIQPVVRQQRPNGRSVLVVVNNQKNSPNKIVDNMSNPEGTIVVNGNSKLEDIEYQVKHPTETIADGKYLNYPYKKGTTVYRTAVVNESQHHSLAEQGVLDDLKLFMGDCQRKFSEVPALVTIEHKQLENSCFFMGYRSLSGLYKNPYHEWRLNMACVFIKLNSKEIFCYIDEGTKDIYHKHKCSESGTD
jgi:hypothetical protein